MDLVARAGSVYQAGTLAGRTLAGHPLSMAAGVATLDALTLDRYAALEATAADLAAGLADVAATGLLPWGAPDRRRPGH